MIIERSGTLVKNIYGISCKKKSGVADYPHTHFECELRSEDDDTATMRGIEIRTRNMDVSATIYNDLWIVPKPNKTAECIVEAGIITCKGD